MGGFRVYPTTMGVKRVKQQKLALQTPKIADSAGPSLGPQTLVALRSPGLFS